MHFGETIRLKHQRKQKACLDFCPFVFNYFFASFIIPTRGPFSHDLFTCAT